MGFMTRALRNFTLAMLLAALGACGGGNTPDPGPDPVVTGLSSTQAYAGQEITISGMNFGSTQGNSTVKLGAAELTITAWAATQITAQVPASATSGTIIIEVNGQQSAPVVAAQLSITTNEPLIQTLSQSYGRPGDVVEISGVGFGTLPGSVRFVAEDGTEYGAGIAVDDTGGGQAALWSGESVSITVPDMPAASYTLFMKIGYWESRGWSFLCYTDTAPIPVITTVTPAFGPPGTMIDIRGEHFGAEQGDSTLMLNDLPLPAVIWSDTRIVASIPAGAQSGKISIAVGTYPEYQWPPEPGGVFIVGTPPEVTGIDPGVLRFGQPITIYGTGFQGVTAVYIGQSAQPIAEPARHSSALISSVTISGLIGSLHGGVEKEDTDGNPIIDEDGLPVLHYEVQVELENGLKSTPVLVPFATNLEATVTVDQHAGQRNGGPGESGTVFSFTPEVTGGSGDYTYYLAPEFTHPLFWSLDQDPSSPDTLEYTYPADPAANYEELYDTQLHIEDNETGDSIIIPGPSLMVVMYGTPVITKIALLDFNNGLLPAPNEWCYQAVIQQYNDFTFVDGGMRVTSCRGDILVDGEPLPSHTRNLSAFTADGSSPRAQGYRYRNDNMDGTDDGAVISIMGLNFGDNPGSVWLGALGMPVQVTDFQHDTDLPSGWSDTEIRFFLPAALQDLSGTVRVIPAGSLQEAFSREPLVCSPYVLGITRDWDYDNQSGRLILAGFDYEPPVTPGLTGTDTYSIWVVRASYTDPWGAGHVTNYGLLTTPVPPYALAGTSLGILYSDLDIDGNGTVPIEVFSASGTESAVVEGTLEPGDYFFYLWTGVLGEGTPEEIAQSGIFSEAYYAEYPVYGMPNQPPVAVLQANPTSGFPPLPVTFDASSSYDLDGSIIDYEWDFDGDGNYSEPGDELAARGSPGPHLYTYSGDTITARVRVTDDGVPLLTDIATQTIYPSGGPNGNLITVNVTLRNFGDFNLTSDSLVRVYYGNPEGEGTLIDQQVFDHQAAGEGNPATHVFYDLPDYTDYYIRVMNCVAYWDGDAGPPPYGYKDLGPYTVPPNQVVNLTGYQYCEPPGPASPGPG